MRGYKIPIYRSGSLITTEMMDSIKDYLLNLSSCPYDGYTDGIISGAEVKVNQGILSLSKGILKHKDALFFLPENTTVPMKPLNQWQAVKVVFADKEIDYEYERIDLEVRMETDLSKQNNSIEVCRVYLQNGANLRSDYKDFDDMQTQFDTVNLLEADWSAYGGKGIHPRILQEFCKQAKKYSLRDAIDLSFYMQLQNLQGRTCQRGLIENYLDLKLGQTKEEYSNLDLYHGLQKALQLIKSGKGMSPQSRFSERRIFVD